MCAVAAQAIPQLRRWADVPPTCDGAWSAWTQTELSTTSMTGSLPVGGAVEIRVRAVAGELLSDWSPVTTAARPLDTPQVTGSASGSAVTLTWQPVPGATSYRVDRQVDGVWVPGTPATGTSVTLAGEHGATLTARVTALNEVSESAPAQVSVAVPVWVPLTLESGWSTYSGGYGGRESRARPTVSWSSRGSSRRRPRRRPAC